MRVWLATANHRNHDARGAAPAARGDPYVLLSGLR
jgi:hypothetical protein